MGCIARLLLRQERAWRGRFDDLLSWARSHNASKDDLRLASRKGFEFYHAICSSGNAQGRCHRRFPHVRQLEKSCYRQICPVQADVEGEMIITSRGEN